MSNRNNGGSERSNGRRTSGRGASSEDSQSEGRTSRGGGRSSGGRSSGGSKGKGDYKFSRIGSLTVAGSTQDEYGEDIVDKLKGENYKLWLKVYLPEGSDTVTLKHEEMLLISIGEVKKAPDFVVGTVSVENQELKYVSQSN